MEVHTHTHGIYSHLRQDYVAPSDQQPLWPLVTVTLQKLSRLSCIYLLLKTWNVHLRFAKTQSVCLVSNFICSRKFEPFLLSKVPYPHFKVQSLNQKIGKKSPFVHILRLICLTAFRGTTSLSSHPLLWSCQICLVGAFGDFFFWIFLM